MQILAFLLVRYSTDKNTKFSAKALFSKPFVIVNFYIAVVLVVLEVFKSLLKTFRLYVGKWFPNFHHIVARAFPKPTKKISKTSSNEASS